MELNINQLSLSIGSEPEMLAQSLLQLTQREWEVLILVTSGRSTSEIAATLFVEPKSVENYRSRIIHKLGLYGQNSLIRYSWVNRDTIYRVYQLVSKKIKKR